MLILRLVLELDPWMKSYRVTSINPYKNFSIIIAFVTCRWCSISWYTSRRLNNVGRPSIVLLGRNRSCHYIITKAVRYTLTVMTNKEQGAKTSLRRTLREIQLLKSALVVGTNCYFVIEA
jgi:hypothetical protein